MSSVFLIVMMVYAGVCSAFVGEISLEQLQIDFANMRTQMGQMKQTISSLQQQLNDTGKLAAQAAANLQHAPVAFTAHLSKTITNVGSHQQVVFDTIISNIGSAYSEHSGHFTAPVFGVYVFLLTLTNVPGMSTSLTIMKDGHDIAHALAHGTAQASGQFETSTIPVVVSLAAGDHVWVQNEGQFTPVEQLDGYNYSSFSGFLLNAL